MPGMWSVQNMFPVYLQDKHAKMYRTATEVFLSRDEDTEHENIVYLTFVELFPLRQGLKKNI